MEKPIERILDMPTVELNHISKSFGAVKAVDDVSFNVEKGEIFGLLGPNGAGKTTAIRVLLDIFKADSGTASILGGPMTEAKKERVGYMPEERGLYQDVQLDRCLVYLATLKGLTPVEAHQRMDEYLQRFDLAAHKKKKVKELSKGMQQKAQLIVTLLHQPELLIVDEPFAGLDPVNTQMVKDLLREQRERGVTILMSTHQMHQVEELCDRLVLIDHGRTVLYGRLNEIQRQFSGHAVVVRTPGTLPTLPGVEKIEQHNSAYQLTLTPGVNTQDLLRTLIEKGIPVEQFEIATPSLDEIFIRVVTENQTGKGTAG
jgi:ABC-2 type transport system ATP-binding protein